MRTSIYEFTLDIKRPTPFPIKRVVSGDTSVVFKIWITDDGTPVTLSSTLDKVVAVFTRADGQVYMQDASTGVSFNGGDSFVTVDVSSGSFKTGVNTIELVIFSREQSTDETYNGQLTTGQAQFTGRAATLSEDTPSMNPQIPLLESYVQRAKYYADLLADVVVTPEMYGAVGDGVTDDTTAIQSAVNSGKIVWGHGATYKVTNVRITSDCDVRDCHFFTPSIPYVSGIAGYAFLVEDDDLSFSFSGCTFESTNDQAAAGDYVTGATSYICFIGDGHATRYASFDRCKFVNAYYAIYIKRDPLTTFRCTNCEFDGHVIGVDIAYCQDAIVDSCRFVQNTNVTGQAHDIYIAEGAGNKALISNCVIDSSSISINCNHGTGYDITIESSRIVTTYTKPILATGSSGAANKIVARNCYIECGYLLNDMQYDTEYVYEGCEIVCTSAGNSVISRPNSSATQLGSSVFNHCTVRGKRLAVTWGATFNDCVFELNAGVSRVIEASDVIMIGCKCTYTCSNTQPIKTAGNCKLYNNYIENTETTDKAVYVTGSGNVFKGNTFVGIPNASVGSADLTNNLFV